MVSVQGAQSGFGITPQGSPAVTPNPAAAPEPNARSPTAKRPLDRSTIQVAETGVRTMSNEDLSSGFISLHSTVEKNEKWSQSVAESVHWNANLVNKLIERVNGLEAAVQLTSTKFDSADAKVEQLTRDTESMLEKVHGKDVEQDNRLRFELNAMSAKLEEGHSNLEAKLKALAEAAQGPSTLPSAAGPPSPPGLDISAMNEQIGALARMGDAISGRVSALETITAGGRLSAIETAATNTEQTIIAIKTAIDGLSNRLDGVVATVAAATASSSAGGATFDPWFGQKLGEAAKPPEHHHMGTRPPSPVNESSGEAPLSGTGARWRLYEEKWVLSGEGKYSVSKPLKWLKGLRNYLAGRCSDMDPLLDWIERQDDEIDHDQLLECVPMVNHAPSLKEVSKQLWAFLQPLTKDDGTMEERFANCPRHNGLEAWRMVAEPINEDKAVLRKQLLSIVTNPRPAGSLDKIETAISEWDTNCRLFAEADGPPQDEQSRRISLVGILPQEINAYITMHWELPEYKTYNNLKKFILKYVKVLKSIKVATARPVHAVGHATSEQQEIAYVEPPQAMEMSEEDKVEMDRLHQQLMASDDPAEQVEILAVMKNRGFRQPGRGQGGPRQGPGNKTRFGQSYMPPRGRQDITCVNCGKKGHAAPECPSPAVDKKDRPCFRCGEKGHESRNCPKKPAARPGAASAKLVEAREPAVCATIVHAPARRVEVLCLTTATTTLGDHIVPPEKGGKAGKGFRNMT